MAMVECVETSATQSSLVAAAVPTSATTPTMATTSLAMPVNVLHLVHERRRRLSNVLGADEWRQHRREFDITAGGSNGNVDDLHERHRHQLQSHDILPPHPSMITAIPSSSRKRAADPPMPTEEVLAAQQVSLVVYVAPIETLTHAHHYQSSVSPLGDNTISSSIATNTIDNAEESLLKKPLSQLKRAHSLDVLVAEALRRIQYRRRFHSAEQRARLPITYEQIVQEIRFIEPSVNSWYPERDAGQLWECRVPMMLLGHVDEVVAEENQQRAAQLSSNMASQSLNHRRFSVLATSAPSTATTASPAQRRSELPSLMHSQVNLAAMALRRQKSLDILAQASSMCPLSKPFLGRQLMLSVDDEGRAFVKLWD